jgi:poly(3-hydroxybutyrate) depolymerase
MYRGDSKTVRRIRSNSSTHLGVVVTLSDPSNPFSDGYDFVDVLVTVEATNLTAQGWVRSVEGDSSFALHRFLAELADDWKGETPDRSWESIEHELKVRCARDGLGHVSLTFTLRGSHLFDAWTAEVTVNVEAGEEMVRFARDVSRLLGRGALRNQQ